MTAETPKMAVVPVDPTEAMLKAGEAAAWDDENSMPAIRAMPKAWAAMLAAAPEALANRDPQAGEAVAWRYAHPNTPNDWRVTDHDIGKDWPNLIVQPLYASPQDDRIGGDDEDSWIEWTGGQNPVPGQKVDVLMREGDLGEVWSDTFISDALQWDANCDCPIVRYRLANTKEGEGA